MVQRELTYDEILGVISGRDEVGAPNSAATLSIDEIISERDVKSINNVIFDNAEITIYTYGGCAVLEVDFPYNSLPSYKRAMALCQEWFNEIEDKEHDNRILSLTLVPLRLLGKIFLLFRNLVYYTGNSTSNGSRLILCFDNNVTNILETEDINYREIFASVEAELTKREEDVDEQILQIEEETRKIKEENVYEKNIQDKYGKMDIEITGESEEYRRPGMRFTEDEEV